MRHCDHCTADMAEIRGDIAKVCTTDMAENRGDNANRAHSVAHKKMFIEKRREHEHQRPEHSQEEVPP
jgi:hypothetical protein